AHEIGPRPQRARAATRVDNTLRRPHAPSAMIAWLSFAGVLVLASVHIIAGKLLPIAPRPRRAWTSLAAVDSIAYLLVQILPELAEGQAHWGEERAFPHLFWLHQQVYLAALAGLLAAYGLDRFASQRGDRPNVRFWLSTSCFALYNALIGYYAAN